MSYTMQRFPDDESEFPTPPMWLVWMSYGYWDRETAQYVEGDGKGQVRHVYNLKKAKKYVSNHGTIFRFSWAIYHWDGTKYVKQYEGKTGERKADNLLFQEKVKDEGFSPRDLTDEELAGTIESIMAAGQ